MQRLPPGSGRERQTLRKLEKVAFCHFFDTLWRRLHPRLHRLPSKSPLRFLRIFISLLRFAHGWPRIVSRIP